MEAVALRDQAIALFRDLDDRAGLITALAHRAGSVTTYHSATAVALPRSWHWLDASSSLLALRH